MNLRAWLVPAALVVTCSGALSVAAQDRPVPYWASLTADEVNMRVGPARDYRIAWVFKRDGLPLKVVRLHEGWRLVEDPDGARGWVLARFLSLNRTALVQGEIADLRAEAGGAGRVLWRVEPGVVGKLGECEGAWCQFDIAGKAGWISAAALWGDGDP